jgi:5-methylcytosine-specific restriction endonuclease McrA
MPKDPRDTRAWRALSLKVRQRDGFVCAYCGDIATTTDHIVSVKEAPDLCLDLDNLVASCRRCNSRKGSRPRRFFLDRAFAPPVFCNNISPITQIKTQNGPCLGQPEMDQS